MHGTHCKHCSLIPPLVFNNNLALLGCGYMCARLVHISRHLGRTSNNNKYQLCIRCIFCRFASIRFYFGFPILWLLYYSYLHPALPLVFYSTSLLPLSYYTMSIPCLISLAIYLPTFVSWCSWHSFNASLYFGFIDTCMLIFTHHLAFASPLAGEFWLSWILMSRFGA